MPAYKIMRWLASTSAFYHFQKFLSTAAGTVWQM